MSSQDPDRGCAHVLTAAARMVDEAGYWFTVRRRHLQCISGQLNAHTVGERQPATCRPTRAP